MHRLAKLILWYDHQLTTRPYTTNMLTNIPLWGFGDIIAQNLENLADPKKEKNIDKNRTLQYTTYGCFVAGPVFAWWYPFLEKKVGFLRTISKIKYVLYKVFADQVC